MTYTVTIRENATAQTSTTEHPGPWEQFHFYMWIDGNYGCDCNLRDMFWGDDDEEILGCGESDYTPLFAVLEDGSMVDIAKAAREEFGYAESPRWQP